MCLPNPTLGAFSPGLQVRTNSSPSSLEEKPAVDTAEEEENLKPMLDTAEEERPTVDTAEEEKHTVDTAEKQSKDISDMIE